MSRSLRSTKGCWTCRLRRKKCDERHPVCQLCHTLAIPCYGYGPKPDWMNGGDTEKSQIQSLKQTVRYTSRQRDRARPQPLRSQSQTVPPSNAPESVLGPKYAPGAAYTRMEQGYLSRSDASSLQKETAQASDTQTNPMLLMGDLSLSDTRLLMHFVDHVYPLQLPISQSSAIQNDRNWLLPIIMHIRPFYHSVLGLAALHQRLLTSQSNDESQQLRALKYAQKHHSLCLQDLQVAIQLLGPYKVKGAECPRGGVGVLASVIQLVLLEMCIDETDNWQVHLNAAIGMVAGVHGVRQRTEIDGDPVAMLHYGWENFEDELYPEHPLLQQQSSMNALIAITIYLDVVSCVTMGKPPRLLKIVHDITDVTPYTQEIRNMFGQEYWVILLIGEIAALHQPILVPVSEDDSVGNCCNSAPHAKLRSTLQGWIRKNAESVEKLQCSEEYTLSASTSIRVTTYLYSLAGIIYFHLTTAGVDDSSGEIRTCVKAFIKSFSLTRHTSTPQNLMWPVYITASVAVGDERPFFRTILSTSASYFSIGSCSRVLKRLEDIWEGRSVSGSRLFSTDLWCPNLLLI
ncbi:C6 transcription factor, putative [Talaromyces stipitatus ATCC 10500]|uniref:C6 transcription factor, putative n=1 Tax=Talaromyces stipitatus (strain ATCC 10500 / CBS 375.48 / QM 6759 / NRRL 1006) TaxID=441959 RepID=B8M3N3_TALSN|nr:C6 transcription factor, putative [Talaromyces stipitatus ATCC 10500]EED22405.1 C6 transcription factor, putative [Talaromyces stipitatus ATCC 10500]